MLLSYMRVKYTLTNADDSGLMRINAKLYYCYGYKIEMQSPHHISSRTYLTGVTPVFVSIIRTSSKRFYPKYFTVHCPWESNP